MAPLEPRKWQWLFLPAGLARKPGWKNIAKPREGSRIRLSQAIGFFGGELFNFILGSVSDISPFLFFKKKWMFFLVNLSSGSLPLPQKLTPKSKPSPWPATSRHHDVLLFFEYSMIYIYIYVYIYIYLHILNNIYYPHPQTFFYSEKQQNFRDKKIRHNGTCEGILALIPQDCPSLPGAILYLRWFLVGKKRRFPPRRCARVKHRKSYITP